MIELVVGLSVYINTKVESFQRSLQSLFRQKNVNIYLILYVDGPISIELNEFIDNNCTNYVSNGCAVKNISIIKGVLNIGIANVINIQIELFLNDYVNTNYYARMDSDDESIDNRFENQIHFLENNQEYMLVGSSAIFRYGKFFDFIQKMPLTNHDIIAASHYYDPFIHPTVLFRKELFIKGYRYPNRVKYMEDTLFWQELIRDGVPMANLEDPLYIYNIDFDAINRRKKAQERKDLLEIRLKRCAELSLGIKYILLAYLRYYIFTLPSFLIYFLYILRGMLSRIIFSTNNNIKRML
jgi:hypothetical protein